MGCGGEAGTEERGSKEEQTKERRKCWVEEQTKERRKRGAVTCRIYDVTSKRRRHLVHHLQPRRPTRRAARRIVSRSRAHAWQVGAPATWPPPPPQKASHTRRRCAGQASQRGPRTLRSPSPPARSPICLRPPQPPSHVPCSRHRFAPPLLPPYNCGRRSRTFRRRLCSRTRMHGCGRGPGRIRRPGRHRRRRFA